MTIRARRRAVAMAVLVLAAAVPACDLVGSDADVEGTYVLDTVNGLVVPATVRDVEEPDGTRWTFSVIDGGIELDAGRYTMWMVTEAHQDGELDYTAQEAWTGSYSASRGQVTFVADETGATGSGRAEGRTIRLTIGTLELGELTLVFVRVS